MLIPSGSMMSPMFVASLSRGMNANSQLSEDPDHPGRKSIKRDEC